MPFRFRTPSETAFDSYLSAIPSTSDAQVRHVSSALRSSLGYYAIFKNLINIFR